MIWGFRALDQGIIVAVRSRDARGDDRKTRKAYECKQTDFHFAYSHYNYKRIALRTSRPPADITGPKEFVGKYLVNCNKNVTDFCHDLRRRLTATIRGNVTIAFHV